MSWAQLLGMLRENRDSKAEAQDAPPDACPIDGALLHIRSDGVRNCPLGNYRWDGAGSELPLL